MMVMMIKMMMMMTRMMVRMMTRIMVAVLKWVWESWGQLWGSTWKIRVKLDSGWWWWWWLSWSWHRFDEKHRRGQFWTCRQNWFGSFSKQLKYFFYFLMGFEWYVPSWIVINISENVFKLWKQERLIVTIITNNQIAFLSPFDIN